MFKKAIVRISLMSLVVTFGIGAVFADAPEKPDTLTLAAESGSYFYTRAASGEVQTYKLNVPAGVTRYVKIEAARQVNVKITTANGQVIIRNDLRLFRIELSDTGETTIEVTAAQYIGLYTISVSGK